MSGQCVLNFGAQEKERIKDFLKRFERAETKTGFEEFRVKAEGNTVTLYSSGRVVIQGDGCGKFRDELLRNLNPKTEEVLGIDETGRGESSGPMVVCGVLGETASLLELRDSKKVRNMAAKYKTATANSLANATVSLNAKFIDRLRAKGMNLNQIEAKIIDSIAGAFAGLGEDAKVRVDGSAMDVRSREVEFIVKGDDREPVIGAASVIAKHTRDISGDIETRKGWRKKPAPGTS